jgi:F0F1-type ATP synthase assembly protein I
MPDPSPSPPNPPPGKPPRRDLAGLYAGFQFGLTVAAALAAGYWVDRRFHSSPWGVIVGFLGGAAAGLYHLARAYR